MPHVDHDPRGIRYKYINRYRFDFEIGYLIGSPCKDCDIRERFPRCMQTCRPLDRIQTLLAEGVSCSRHT